MSEREPIDLPDRRVSNPEGLESEQTGLYDWLEGAVAQVLELIKGERSFCNLALQVDSFIQSLTTESPGLARQGSTLLRTLLTEIDEESARAWVDSRTGLPITRTLSAVWERRPSVERVPTHGLLFDLNNLKAYNENVSYLTGTAVRVAAAYVAVAAAQQASVEGRLVVPVLMTADSFLLCPVVGGCVSFQEATSWGRRVEAMFQTVTPQALAKGVVLGEPLLDRSSTDGGGIRLDASLYQRKFASPDAYPQPDEFESWRQLGEILFPPSATWTSVKLPPTYRGVEQAVGNASDELEKSKRVQYEELKIKLPRGVRLLPRQQL